MTEKSHVGLEAKLCQVCGSQYETGSILLESRLTHYNPHKNPPRELRKTLDHMNVTGVGGFCTKCDKLHKDGFVALIGVNNAPEEGEDILKQENADRTGAIAHLRKEAWERVFNSPVPHGGMVFCDQEVIEKLETMMHPDDRDDPDNLP